MQRENLVRLTSVRPLVRYVDEQRGVLDVHVTVRSTAPSRCLPDTQEHEPFTLLIRMTGPDGLLVEDEAAVDLSLGGASVRFELLSPQRWWPAGMGEQMLYDLTVLLRCGDLLLDTFTTTTGLTSVRGHEADAQLLVNGQVCTIRRIVPIEPVDETGILPVSSDSLLLVRDHIGPKVLYDAADRAGILLVQAIRPEDLFAGPDHDATGDAAGGEARMNFAHHLDRLVTHPCLAGWLVERVDDLSMQLIHHLRQLDPAHRVFRHLPGQRVA